VAEREVLRDKLAEGEVVFEPFMKMASPKNVEIVCHASFNSVIPDTEHDPPSFETVESLVRTAEVVDMAPLRGYATRALTTPYTQLRGKALKNGRKKLMSWKRLHPACGMFDETI